MLNTLVTTCTYFIQGNGPEYSSKVARLTKTNNNQILKNVKAVIKGLLKVLISKNIKLGNIWRISLKGEQTDSFPIYSYLTLEEKRILKENI